MYRFFTPEKDPKMVGLDEGLMKMLDASRYNANIPFIITSGLRTPEKSVSVGGYCTDSHTKGLAVDILCTNNSNQLSIVIGAYRAGFTRIGLGKNHVHLDIDPEKPQHVLWVEK